MAKRKKQASPGRLAVAWMLPLGLWGLFSWWYSNTGGPLSAAEIDHYLTIMEERGSDPERRDLLRSFLEADTGDDFAMLNLIELNANVPPLDGLPPEATAEDAVDAYMAYMWPALFRRACHPLVFGTAAANAMDVWGIDGATTWSQGALMRYRSRRDLMEIATNPEFNGPHEFKIAGMTKTIAIPLDPWVQAGDPRLLLGLFALLIALLYTVLAGRR